MEFRERKQEFLDNFPSSVLTEGIYFCGEIELEADMRTVRRFGGFDNVKEGLLSTLQADFEENERYRSLLIPLKDGETAEFHGWHEDQGYWGEYCDFDDLETRKELKFGQLLFASDDALYVDRLFRKTVMAGFQIDYMEGKVVFEDDLENFFQIDIERSIEN